MKFKIGDGVFVDNNKYEMGCCHDCDGTEHYLTMPEFTIHTIEGGYAFAKDEPNGYDLQHLSMLTKLELALK